MTTNNPFTPLRDNDLEGDLTFHDTLQHQLQQSNSNSNSSADVSIKSQLQPTNLVNSPSILPFMTPQTITIGGVTISVESSEQVQTTTRALYTKAIRKTYDDDKKGKLDLLKLVQSKQ
jgi:siroheme synthase (precorrin-2 oxidase/ferrochelatase)